MKKAISILLFFSGIAISATSISNERVFKEEKLEKFRKDADFSYIEKEPETDLFGDFLKAFFKKFFGMAESTEAIKGMEYLFYFFAAAALIYAVASILKTDLSSLLLKKPNSATIVSDLHEDIREINLETFLNKYMEEKNFRMATRYLFLIVLRDLNDLDLIAWSPEKTNKDYEKELRKYKEGTEFSKLSKVFSYTWYGNLPVNEAYFHTISESFNSFRNSIKKIKI